MSTFNITAVRLDPIGAVSVDNVDRTGPRMLRSEYSSQFDDSGTIEARSVG